MAGKKPTPLGDKAREKIQKGIDKVLPARKKLSDALRGTKK